MDDTASTSIPSGADKVLIKDLKTERIGLREQLKEGASSPRTKEAIVKKITQIKNLLAKESLKEKSTEKQQLEAERHRKTALLSFHRKKKKMTSSAYLKSRPTIPSPTSRLLHQCGHCSKIIELTHDGFQFLCYYTATRYSLAYYGSSSSLSHSP